MNDLEFRLRGAWNNLEGIVTDMLNAGHTDEARVVSKCAATIRALQSAMTAASEETERVT
jgi:hypothetical protein